MQTWKICAMRCHECHTAGRPGFGIWHSGNQGPKVVQQCGRYLNKSINQVWVVTAQIDITLKNQLAHSFRGAWHGLTLYRRVLESPNHLWLEFPWFLGKLNQKLWFACSAGSPLHKPYPYSFYRSEDSSVLGTWNIWNDARWVPSPVINYKWSELGAL